MKNAVLQIMNYAAVYRGNFMESLTALDERLKEKDTVTIYLFCKDAEKAAKIWIDDMVSAGDIVRFLSDDHKADVRLIKDLIREYNVKLIHTHFLTMPQFLSIYCANRRSNLPIVMHMHNHSKKAGNIIKRKISHFIYRKCYMVACSKSVYDSLIRDYPKNKKCYIDNGVYFERLEKFETLDKRDFGVSEDEKLLLIFGFDFYRKGVDLAIKAVSDLRKAGLKYSLLVSLSTNFEEAESNVKKILGEVPDWIKLIKARSDVASFYNAVDMFLSPSREEGLPYSVIEAEYSRCNVVLSNISAQIHLKLKYGVWFKKDDPEDLKNAILKAEKLREEKLNNMDSVKEFMRENYSLSKWVDEVVELYGSILS